MPLQESRWLTASPVRGGEYQSPCQLFVPVLSEFFGPEAGFSAATITQLTQRWRSERKSFMKMDLSSPGGLLSKHPLVSSTTGGGGATSPQGAVRVQVA
jgi:hypothetical protein